MNESSAAHQAPPELIPDSVLRALRGSTWMASWCLAVPGSIACLLPAVRLALGKRRTGGKMFDLPRARTQGPRIRAHAASRILGCFFLVLGAGSVLANAYTSYIPNLRSARRVWAAATRMGNSYREPGQADGSIHGEVSVVRLEADPALRVLASNAWVYTPPGYERSGRTRYPVLYLIHGYPGTAADWFVAGETDRIMDVLVAQQLIEPMIVVSLDVNGGFQRDSGCLDAIDGPQMESWLYGKVLPYVDATYATDPTRTQRILGGVSAGGYCALDQGLRHQGTWGTILSFEGYGDPGRGGRIAFKGDRAAIRAHSPSSYLPTMAFTHPQAFYLDSGDRLGKARVAKLARLLAARGQLLHHRINPGVGHSWSEVRAGLPHALVFASRQLAG